MNSIIKILNNNHFLFKTHMSSLIPFIQNIDIDYTKYIKVNTNTYDRNTVYKNDLFEIVMINWMPNQYSKTHGHPSNGCIMKILDGRLYESRTINNHIVEYEHLKNNISFVSDTHYVGNYTNKPTISMHIYSPPHDYE